MLFLIGIKDDILALSPFKKLAVQITAAFLLVVGGGVVLTDFGGLFYLDQVPWIAGVGISVFILVAIVNSYNLIDGIDGLAGGIGIIVSAVLGIWFWAAGFLSLAVLSFALSGSLISFLMFNMYPAKIFMGDTGAMAVGFIIGFLAIEFISLNASIAGEGWHIANGQVFAITILIVPIVDTLRVFTLRLARGKHPFTADRNHTHHKLLEIGMQHHLASFSLWLANIIVIGFGFMINHLQINLQLFLVMLLGLLILPSIGFIYQFSIKFIENRRSKRETEALYDTH